MTFSDGGISAEELAATDNVIKNILTGRGTESTSGQSSYEFSQGDMEKIYDAMGCSFSSHDEDSGSKQVNSDKPLNTAAQTDGKNNVSDAAATGGAKAASGSTSMKTPSPAQAPDPLINGQIEYTEQGEVGDCWLLSQINAFSDTDFGKEALKNAIKVNDDGSYSVVMKGSDETFTFSKEELIEAVNSGKYAYGDADMVLLELAFERHYDLALKKAKETMSEEELKSYLDEESSIDGGHGKYSDNPLKNKDLYFLLSGNKNSVSEACYFQEALKLKAENPSNVAITIGSNYDIETGEEFDSEGGSHAYSIKEVHLDENGNITSVDLINPWQNDKIINIKGNDINKYIKKFNMYSNDTELSQKFKNEKLNTISGELASAKNKNAFASALSNAGMVDLKQFIEENGGVKKLHETFNTLNNSYNYDDYMNSKWFSNIIFSSVADAEARADIAEHPEKMEEYCKKYGFMY